MSIRLISGSLAMCMLCLGLPVKGDSSSDGGAEMSDPEAADIAAHPLYRLNVSGDAAIHGSLDMGVSGVNQWIINLADPAQAQDAATKAYVDGLMRGVGDISGVTAGTGLSGGGTSGTVTLNANAAYLQRRVSGACAVGNSMRVINQDGTVTCEPHATAAGDITGVVAGTGLSGGGATGEVMLSANTAYLQRRVANACAFGSSIRTIGQEGTVTCEVDDSGDNLGNHTATVNVRLNNHWLSGDGGNEGLYVDADGKVGIGIITPETRLHVVDSAATTYGAAIYGQHGRGIGVKGLGGNTGVLGEAVGTAPYLYTGVVGEAYVGGSTGSSMGVLGRASGGVNAYGIHGWASGAENNYAGLFTGNVSILGTLTKSGGSFKIDHPLDPDNKYLSHSFVESPDMMNVYNGNIVLDSHGEAWVELPDWFESLNRDFRYQLTAMSAPGPYLHIAEEVSGNRFKIAGGAAGLKVSWQVTGVRQDAWAEANRIVVEEDKPQRDQGRFLNPEVFGQPSEKAIHYLEPKAEETGLRDG